MDKPQLPLSLKVVAVLFILGGISSIIEVALDLTQGHINLNFGVLGLFIGLGLLRLSPGWRTCALVFTWLGLLFAPIVALVMFNHAGPLDLKFFGQKIGTAGIEFGLLICVALFLYSLWQYRVLTRRDVKLLFRLPLR